MTLETAFAWLQNETGPAFWREARRLYGTAEYGGSTAAYSNPVIMSWADETGLRADYTGDLTAWCGLAAAVVVQRAGYSVVATPLRALSWRSFGVHAAVPAFMDLMIFKRTGGYHVAFYAAEDSTHYYVIGGNQANRFCLAAMDKKDFIEARRPDYLLRPYSSRPVILDDKTLTVISGAQVNLMLVGGAGALVLAGLYFLHTKKIRIL